MTNNANQKVDEHVSTHKHAAGTPCRSYLCPAHPDAGPITKKIALPDEGEWVLVFNLEGERGEVEAVYEEMAKCSEDATIVYSLDRFMKAVERD